MKQKHTDEHFLSAFQAYIEGMDTNTLFRIAIGEKHIFMGAAGDFVTLSGDFMHDRAMVEGWGRDWIDIYAACMDCSDSPNAAAWEKHSSEGLNTDEIESLAQYQRAEILRAVDDKCLSDEMEILIGQLEQRASDASGKSDF